MDTAKKHFLRKDFSRIKFIGCGTIIEEAITLLPSGMSYQMLDFGLHVKADNLKTILQDEINHTSKDIQYIILGYGLCSGAVIGLMSESSTLIIPRVTDCIGLFTGSRERYREIQKAEPGTYYLTKGWLKSGGTVFNEFEKWQEHYGEPVARRILQAMLRNYTTLCFIETGHDDIELYQRQARDIAMRFNLRFKTIKGATDLLYRMFYGPWDDEIVIVRPGEIIQWHHFQNDSI